jgi:hypothetical protein
MGINNEKVPDMDFHQKIEEAFKFRVAHDKPLSEIFSPFWDSLTQNTDYVALIGAILDTVGERVNASCSFSTRSITLIFFSQRRGPDC